jgi:hypothetical protein
MPLQATSGAASYDAFGGGVPAEPNYIESCFSTWLYAGTSATQTITNGIDLAGKGGLVWVKNRNFGVNHQLTDTVRGLSQTLESSTTSAQYERQWIDSVSANGFTLSGTVGGISGSNGTGYNYVTWTFREAPKFFDVVTYTGNGSTQTISHNLGAVPGMMIVKSSSASTGWIVYHQALGNSTQLVLNSTNAAGTGATAWNSTTPTSTQFYIGNNSNVNTNGATYVAYLFAHNAGGFGLTGTDNVISCGSFTTNASGVATVNLGYEPQWVLWKAYGGTTGTSDWDLFDNMRGYSVPGASNDRRLQPNNSNAEGTVNIGGPNATGFTVENQNATSDYIYIAIRRGPMKVPTTGTSVFAPVAWSGSGSGTFTTPTNFPVDMQFTRRIDNTSDTFLSSRLMGNVQYLATNLNAGSTNLGSGNGTNNSIGFASNVGVGLSGDWNTSASRVAEGFRRAPGFFDVVCYTGMGGGGGSITHNLGVAPQLIIVKKRNASGNWIVRPPGVANNYLVLDSTANSQSGAGNYINNPTATTFGIGDNANVNVNGDTFIAYLFATCPGVSSVGSYTGTGTTLQINCGFTSGARFVLIKRTDSNGGWFFWDSARGIVPNNDPYLRLESTSSEVTNTDFVDTNSAGFELSSTSGSEPGINNSGGTYIYLAIA